MIKQRDDDDCTICAIAMATGLTYEDVMATARFSEGGYRYQGKPGTMSPKGVLIDLGFEARRVMIGASIRQAVWRAFLWGRRAVLSMPSLNGFDGHHDVYWDGHAICDPTTKTPYAPAALDHATPLWAVVIDERADVAAPAEARSVEADWVLVPREPTEAMLNESFHAVTRKTLGEHNTIALAMADKRTAHDHKAKMRWRAMLAALPAPAEARDHSDVVDAAIKEVTGRFRDWQPTPSMRGFARAVGYAALASSSPAHSEQADDDHV